MVLHDRAHHGLAYRRPDGELAESQREAGLGKNARQAHVDRRWARILPEVLLQEAVGSLMAAVHVHSGRDEHAGRRAR